MPKDEDVLQLVSVSIVFLLFCHLLFFVTLFPLQFAVSTVRLLFMFVCLFCSFSFKVN